MRKCAFLKSWLQSDATNHPGTTSCTGRLESSKLRTKTTPHKREDSFLHPDISIRILWRCRRASYDRAFGDRRRFPAKHGSVRHCRFGFGFRVLEKGTRQGSTTEVMIIRLSDPARLGGVRAHKINHDFDRITDY